MKTQMSESEKELRSQFDFSKAVRGRHSDRYARGQTVTLLEGEPDMDDPLAPAKKDSQLTEIFGKNLLIGHLIAAGLEVAEPVRDKGVDLVAYRGEEGEVDFVARPIQLKAYSNESFGLDMKYKRIPHLLIAYVWNVQIPERSEVFVLTFEEALEILNKKGYSKTDSWIKGGRYFVRDAGHELREYLAKYKMTRERWLEKLQAA